MRLLLVLALVGALGCRGNKSKLEQDRGADADALWALAPEGTQLGAVATPHAVDLAARAIAAIRQLVALPEYAPLKPQVDALAARMFGTEAATPADAGLATDRAFAVFATGSGIAVVMPVGDRDKFMKLKKGTRGPIEDTLEGATCRELKQHYVCVTNHEMFDRVGSGSLRGKLKAAGARGDIELYVASIALAGDAKGELAIAAQLEDGEISIHGHWLGTPEGFLGKLAGVKAPKLDPENASGFVSIDAAHLLAELPEVPITSQTTLQQLGKSFVGPIKVMIPAGTVDLQLTAPLSDKASASDAIDHCQALGTLLPLAEHQVPGACRLALQGTNQLELDTWVEGTTLRIGAKKGPPPAGKQGALTAVGRELAGGTWTAMLWGRGSMLNLTGVPPATKALDPGVAISVHTLSLVNELGLAIAVANDGVQFRGYLRTAWANPAPLVAKLIAMAGNDIVMGKATQAAQLLAATWPATPFAADFNAGQGGLMLPAATIGLGSAIVLPLVFSALGIDTIPTDPERQPVDETHLVSLLVHAYVEEAYPKWQAEHKDKKCPASIEELATYFGDPGDLPVLTDPWGNPLVMKCNDKGIKVFSVGADGKPGTPDDVRSW